MTDKRILAHLKKDPPMRRLIAKYPPPNWDYEVDLFSDLVESIVSQQLSDKAAATIFGRFKKLFKAKSFPTAEQILAVSDEAIRQCGISFAKIKYIKGVCQAIVAGELDVMSLPRLADEEVVKELTKLKGIGQWTAEMILMFSLKRPDVFSVGDLGLRTAVSRLYGVDRDEIKKIEAIALKWSPYRSCACRYLWKSLGEKK